MPAVESDARERLPKVTAVPNHSRLDASPRGQVTLGGHSPATTFGDVVLTRAQATHVFATDEEMMDVLEVVGLAGRVPDLLAGWDAVLGSGDKRCRLLLTHILLLDEPAEHLDTTGGAEMMEL